MTAITPMTVSEIRFDSSKLALNLDDELVREQVAMNIRRGLPQLKPYAPNQDTVALVCGGPSLNQTEDELIEAHWAGAKVVALNGSYNWCIERRIRPSAMVMLDAREFNARFVEQPVPGCKYLLASQCHPRAFELCRAREVTIWHAVSTGEAEHDLIKRYYFDQICPIGIGTTIAIRAISVLRMLGFQSFDIFGLDSCYLGGAHHAYAQAENDGDEHLVVWAKPRDRDDKVKEFVCSPWQMKQVEDFQNLVRERGNLFRLNVRGPGLIAFLLQTGFEAVTEAKAKAA